MREPRPQRHRLNFANQQPTRNDVAVPDVDDDINRLLEQIALAGNDIRDP